MLSSHSAFLHTFLHSQKSPGDKIRQDAIFKFFPVFDNRMLCLPVNN